MRARSLALPSAALLLAALCFGPSGTATAGDDPAPLRLEGAPALITPPSGPWTRRERTVVAGQWFVEWREAQAGALLRAHVFPVRQAREPEPLLTQAVDIFLRGLGVDGFGMPTRRLLTGSTGTEPGAGSPQL